MSTQGTSDGENPLPGSPQWPAHDSSGEAHDNREAHDSREYSISLPWPHPPAYYKLYGNDGADREDGRSLDPPRIPAGNKYFVFGTLDSVSTRQILDSISANRISRLISPT